VQALGLDAAAAAAPSWPAHARGAREEWPCRQASLCRAPGQLAWCGFKAPPSPAPPPGSTHLEQLRGGHMCRATSPSPSCVCPQSGFRKRIGLHPPACAAGVRAHARCECCRDRVSCRCGCARGPCCAHGGAFRAWERSAGRSVLRHRGVAAVCLGLCGRLPKRRRACQAAACGLVCAGLRRALPLPLAPARRVRPAQRWALRPPHPLRPRARRQQPRAATARPGTCQLIWGGCRGGAAARQVLCVRTKALGERVPARHPFRALLALATGLLPFKRSAATAAAVRSPRPPEAAPALRRVGWGPVA